MLDVYLLSEQRVSGGPRAEDRPLSSRSLDLLAYLVLHAGTPQTRQHLAFVFWPDSNEAQARTNLRRELHHLRGMLGEEPSLVVGSTSLSWCDCPTCRVDVRVFEQECHEASRSKAAGDIETFLVHATAAIAEYRGDLMPGSYEEWVLENREALLRKCVQLCDDVVDFLAESGQPVRALDFAHRRVQLQPLEEVGYRTLMALQVDSGDRAAAVSTFHRCADTLERQLGLGPSAETTDLVDRLLDRPRDAAGRREEAAEPPSSDATVPSGLVARGQELDVLVERWRVANSGQPGIALVSGEPGVGKSRLLVELATIASAEGAAVATTRCFSQSGRLAFAPVAEWVRSTDIRPAVEGLEPLWREEVARLIPDVVPAERGERSARTGSPGFRAMVDAWQRHRFFEGLARAVLASGRPVLLVLDDVQWCDQETMAWLVFLLGFAKRARLLVAGSARLDELERNREVAAALRGLRSAGLVVDVELTPFDIVGTGELAAALLGRDLGVEEEELVQAATGGYPLFVLEAARTLTDLAYSGAPLPTLHLDAVLRRRFERASPAAQEVAGLAAAVGRNFSLDLLSEAAELDPDALVQAVDELWRLRILRESASGYDFSHDLMRDAAYASVSPARRWLLHRRVAEALEVVHADQLDRAAAALAEQYARGGRPDRALGYFAKAAEAATSLFANAEAVRLYRRCLELIEAMPDGRDRDDQELEILQAMSAPSNGLYGYASPVVQATLEKTVLLAERLGRTPVLVRSLVALFGTRFVQGDIEQSYEVADRALILAGGDAELVAQAHFAFAGSVLSLGQPGAAATHFDLAIELAPTTVSLLVGTRLDVHSQGWSAHAHWLLGDDTQAAARAADALSRARTADHPYSLAVALAYAAITAQLRRDPIALEAAIAELSGLCRRYEFAYYGEWALVLEGWARGGEAGLTQVRDGIARLRSLGSHARMPYWLCLLSSTLEGVGRREEAAAVLDGATIDAEQRHDRWWLPEVLRRRAALAQGPAAGALLRRACELAREHGSRALESRCMADLLTMERSGPLEVANP